MEEKYFKLYKVISFICIALVVSSFFLIIRYPTTIGFILCVILPSYILIDIELKRYSNRIDNSDITEAIKAYRTSVIMKYMLILFVIAEIALFLYSTLYTDIVFKMDLKVYLTHSISILLMILIKVEIIDTLYYIAYKSRKRIKK